MLEAFITSNRRCAQGASWLKLAMVSGSEITDEAKMTAITPLWSIFSGR